MTKCRRASSCRHKRCNYPRQPYESETMLQFHVKIVGHNARCCNFPADAAWWTSGCLDHLRQLWRSQLPSLLPHSSSNLVQQSGDSRHNVAVVSSARRDFCRRLEYSVLRVQAPCLR